MWQANRPFILRVAAGLAVFLILMNFAIRSQIEGKRKTAGATNALSDLSDDLQKMDGVHKKHQQSAKALEGQVDQLLNQLSLERRAEVEPPRSGDTPTIDFPRRKESIWSAFGDRAKRINLRFPEINEVSFAERKDLTEEEWGDRYAQLEVLRRILDAAIAAQIDRIVSVSPGGLVTEPIEGDAELTLHRVQVGLKIESTYPELLAFVRSFQSPETFVSIELSEVVPADRRSEGGPGVVEATLTAVGIDLAPPREDVKRPGRTPRRGRGF